MQRVIAILMCFSILVTGKISFGQNLNGHWFGVGVVQEPKQNNNYLAELVIRQKDKAIWGALFYYFKDSLVFSRISGSFDKKTRILTLQPFPLIYYRSPTIKNSIDCNMSGYFRLVASKTGSQLEGKLVSDEDHKYTVPDIVFKLKKSNDTAKLVMKDEPDSASKPLVMSTPMKALFQSPEYKRIKDTLVSTRGDTQINNLSPTQISPRVNNTFEAFKKRQKELTKVMEVNNSTLKLEFYDNGVVDNDSISVFFNNKQVLQDSRLDITPLKITVQLDTTLEYNELSMFAINLGNIPPNTALLVLYDGTIRYEIFLSSDLKSSATLRLHKRKPIKN